MEADQDVALQSMRMRRSTTELICACAVVQLGGASKYSIADGKFGRTEEWDGPSRLPYCTTHVSGVTHPEFP